MHIQEVFNAMFKNHHYEYLIVNQKMEVIEFSDRVIDYCDAKLLKDDTIDLYTTVLNTLSQFANGRLITNDLIKEYLEFKSKHLTVSGVNIRIGVLGAIFRAIGNPSLLDGISKRRATKKAYAYFDNNQIHHIMSEMDKHDQKTLFFNKIECLSLKIEENAL